MHSGSAVAEEETDIKMNLSRGCRLRTMDEAQQLQAKIARYRRTLRAVFDPDVLRRLGQMIEIAEKRLAEIERV
jgi:predicted  nucleic acid-binding Zn-ribbon protein